MATERQIAANRANAQHSTGPRTEEGKAASSSNALQHGLTAGSILLKHEDPDEFAALWQNLCAQLAPVGTFETEMVARLVEALWQLRRAPAYEAALVAWISHYQTHSESFARDRSISVAARGFIEADTEQSRLGRGVGLLFERGDHLTKLARYEGHLMRKLDKILLLLRQAQSGRAVAASADLPSSSADANILAATNAPQAIAQFILDTVKWIAAAKVAGQRGLPQQEAR